MVVEVSLDQDPRHPLTLHTLPVSQGAHHLQQSILGVRRGAEEHCGSGAEPTDLGQLLSSEVERDGLRVSGVVDFDVNLVVVFVFSDQSGFQTGHLVLLAVHEDLGHHGERGQRSEAEAGPERRGGVTGALPREEV